MGRATVYDWPTVFDEVCDWLASGRTVRDYCRQDGKPSDVAIYQRVAADPALGSRIAHARAQGADRIAEEALAIADTPQIGTTVTEDEDGRKVVHEDMLGHRKLQVDTRLRLLSKWNSGRYGDKLEHSGEIKTSPMTPDERAARLAAILLDAGRRKGGSGATEQSGTVADGTE